MHICPSCGTGFQDDEEFCLDCGLKLTAGEQPSDSGGAPRALAEDAHPSAQAAAGPSSSTARGAGAPAKSGERKPGAGKTVAGKTLARKSAAGAAAPGESRSARGGKTPAMAPAAARSPRGRQPDPTTDRLMRYRPVYKAPDEWTAVTIKELLRSAGLSAQVLPVAEPFDDGIDRLIEGYWGKVLVLESDLEDACRLIGDYLRGLDRSMH